MEYVARTTKQLTLTFGLWLVVLEPGSRVLARRSPCGALTAWLDGIYECRGLSENDLELVRRAY